MPDTSTQRKGKASADRSISRTAPSSLDDEEQPPRPAKRQRRYHIITADSHDDGSAAVPVDNPEKSTDQYYAEYPRTKSVSREGREDRKTRSEAHAHKVYLEYKSQPIEVLE
ncbi:hypothetical protein V6N11_051752 [Hibiscus sabdariffa]|uniref:Uncharacterized protein n=1 Tax=Hibiscus sabdariffa TaxID=183260 RepID=A0ABR2U8T2_9ROSI